MPGQPATVLSVWEGLAEVLVRSGGGYGAGGLDFEEIDAASERACLERAQQGVERAH
jgi:hypothetical protein